MHWCRIRRQAWLDASTEDAQHDEGDRQVPLQPSTGDKYKVDLDVFKMKVGKKPKDWKTACRYASYIHVDEMRALLELHYDNVPVGYQSFT